MDMKPYKIKKKADSISVKYIPFSPKLPKPKLPRKLFTKVHEAKNAEWTFN